MNSAHPVPDPSCMDFYDVKSQLARFIQLRSEEAFARGEAARAALQTVTELASYQARVRERFLTSVGGLPASAPSLNARITGRWSGDGYHGENLLFTSRPGVHVTANLYLPTGHQGPGGAVLFLCGHAPEGKHHPDYLNACLHLVGAGLVVLAMDPPGQGERLSFTETGTQVPASAHPVWEHSYVGCRCLLLGQSYARYFLHDALRALDYLSTRPEVDPARIGVTGSSGGGTQTCLLMLTEPRIAAAAPVNFLTSRRAYLYAGGAQDAEQIWPGFTADGFDHENFLIAMAPRPVLVCATDSDFFPIEGTRETVSRCRRFWQIHGAEDRLQLFVDQAPHRFTTALARQVATFFVRHLQGETQESDRRPPRPPPVATMQVTATGQVMTAVVEARDALDDISSNLDALAARRAAMNDATRRQHALAWLRQVVTSPREPCDANPRRFATEKCADLSVSRYLWWSQPGLMNGAMCFLPDQRPIPAGGWPVTLAVWCDGTAAIARHLDWIRATCARDRSVWVLDVSGMGGLEPHPINARPLHGMFGTLYRLADDLLWLNDSLAAMRVHDVLRALSVITRLDGCATGDIHLHAHGPQGTYARLAACLDDRVQQVTNVNGLESFDAWVRPRHYDDQSAQALILPHALEYFDLPDLDRWLKAR